MSEFQQLFFIGTGIGERGEKIAQAVFKDIVPRKISKIKKNKRSLINNPIYENYCIDFNVKASNFDLLIEIENQLKRIEVKVIRAARSTEPVDEEDLWAVPSSLRDRALTFSERKECGNITFQQTKADMFDYLLGIVIYLDQMDFVLVPSTAIKSGELKITNQHAGAIKEDGSTNEGHLCLLDVEDKYKICTVFTKEEVENSNLMLSKYIHDRNI